MSPPIDLNDPIAVLLAASEAVASAGVEAAAYGGLALAVYGEPRETRDADLALSIAATSTCLNALRSAGLDGTVSFDGVTFGGHSVARIAIVGGDDATGLNTVDLVTPLSARYARAALARAVRGALRGRPIAVLSPEDFVIFKLLSTRERDLDDAATVLRSRAEQLDGELVRGEIAQLVPETPEHDLAGRFARWQAMRSG